MLSCFLLKEMKIDLFCPGIFVFVLSRISVSFCIFKQANRSDVNLQKIRHINCRVKLSSIFTHNCCSQRAIPNPVKQTEYFAKQSTAKSCSLFLQNVKLRCLSRGLNRSLGFEKLYCLAKELRAMAFANSLFFNWKFESL